jgi:pyruvate-ferredoxin/flavodoxin oxidoreductase
MYQENRFSMLARSKPEEAKLLLKQAQGDVNTRWQMYQYLAERPIEGHNGNGHGNGKQKAESEAKASEVK